MSRKDTKCIARCNTRGRVHAQVDAREEMDMVTVVPSSSASFRLPPWVMEFLRQKTEERQESKTQIVVEAIACLRERELAALMEEGYREMAEENLSVAESSLPAAAETLPEW